MEWVKGTHYLTDWEGSMTDTEMRGPDLNWLSWVTRIKHLPRQRRRVRTKVTSNYGSFYDSFNKPGAYVAAERDHLPMQVTRHPGQVECLTLMQNPILFSGQWSGGYEGRVKSSRPSLRETRDKRKLGKDPDRNWCNCHNTNVRGYPLITSHEFHNFFTPPRHYVYIVFLL